MTNDNFANIIDMNILKYGVKNCIVPIIIHNVQDALTFKGQHFKLFYIVYHF